MRNVMRNHDETAHVWASQSQESGRAPDGRMFFDGRALYSYGRHFVLGYVTERGKIVLLNSDSYSVSTGKHKTITWRATSHYRQFDVPGLTDFVRQLENFGRPGQVLDGSAWREETPAEVKARDVSRVVAHVRANPGMNAEAGAYLFQLAGARDGAKVFAATLARKARETAASEARGRREAHKQGLGFARDILAMPVATLPRELRSRDSVVRIDRGTYNYRTGTRRPDKVKHTGRLADFLATARTAHAAAKAEGWSKARVSRLWGVVTLARDILATRAASHAVFENNRNRRAYVRGIRQAIAGRGGVATVEWSATAYDQAASYAVWLGDTLPRKSEMGQTRAARLYALADDWRAKRDAMREAEARERLERERAAREAWQRGEPGARFRSTDAQGRAYIRAIDVTRDETGAITGGDIETSQGAYVPLPHAVRAFRFLKLCHDRGQGWKANGRTLPVGHYRVSEVEPDGSFVAGCHRIGWAEVERVALQLGIFEAPADESALVETAH